MPEALLLDTSVVVEAVLPAQPGHEACAELFRRLAASSCTVVFNRLLESLSWSCVELDEVIEEVPWLMRSHGLRSYGAVHAASLHAAGIRDMRTLDHGFAGLPQSALTLHTIDTRVATMRRRRATTRPAPAERR